MLVTDVQDEKGQALTDVLGPNAVYLHVDVSLEDDVEQAVRHATETFGGLDVMFNNAGIAGAVGPIEAVSYTHLTLPTTPYV